MKWFKHYSSARNDERISKLEDSTGLEGYGFYFKVLEVIAEVMDASDSCSVTYSRSRWGRQLNITTKKFMTLAQRCSDVDLITLQQSGDNFTITTPNILKYRDNHTKNLQLTCKEVVSNLDLEKEKEKEKEKPLCTSSGDECATNEKINSLYTKSFLAFWEMYPHKKSKGYAAKVFAKIKAVEYPSIRVGLEAAINSSAWKKNNGEFIPHPGTWLQDRGWEDEQPATAAGKPFDMQEFMRSHT